jgi:hypothetical protein
MKESITSTGIELETLRLVSMSLDKIPHRGPKFIYTNSGNI